MHMQKANKNLFACTAGIKNSSLGRFIATSLTAGIVLCSVSGGFRASKTITADAASSSSFDYSGTYSGALTADGTSVTKTSGTFSASTADENAALVENGGTLKLSGVTLKKSGGDSNGDNCNFYGCNSILLAVGSASKAYISNSTLTASDEGSNGIFATDSASVYANNVDITTSSSNSRGLDATYGGTIIANLMNITTAKDHCAGLATDRGGGYISVSDSTVKTSGNGSPVIYSTGIIEVNNLTGTAASSQAVGMEGLNAVRIYNSSLTGADAKASEPYYNAVMIYQSTSGDSTSGTAYFEAKDSTIKSYIDDGKDAAAFFYLTNTAANIVLDNTTLDYDSDKALLLAALGNDCNSWGSAGSNGAKVTMTGIGQTLKGDILVDTISSLDLYLTDTSVYTGAASIETNSVNTDKSDAPLTVNIDGTSEWILTGNSTVTNLNLASGAKIVDASGKTVSIVVNGTKKVTGTSSYTLTVTGTYNASATIKGSTLTASAVDRTAFDTYYGTSTAGFITSTTQAVMSSSNGSSNGGMAPNGTPGASSGAMATPPGGFGGGSGTAPNGTPGAMPSGTAPNGTPGAMPSGTAPSGTPGAMPSGTAPSGTPGAMPSGTASATVTATPTPVTVTVTKKITNSNSTVTTVKTTKTTYWDGSTKTIVQKSTPISNNKSTLIKTTSIKNADGSSESIYYKSATSGTSITAYTKHVIKYTDGSSKTAYLSTVKNSGVTVSSIKRTVTVSSAGVSKTSVITYIRTATGTLAAKAVSKSAVTTVKVSSVTSSKKIEVSVYGTSGLTKGKTAYVYIKDSSGNLVLNGTYKVSSGRHVTIKASSAGTYYIYSSKQ